MGIDEAEAAGSRPPPGSGPGRFDAWALRSAGIPFRVKVAVVWLAIAILIGFFFWLANFDNAWIRDRIDFIAGGLTYTIAMALGGIVLAICLALVGALGRLSRHPIAYGVSGFYTSFFRGTPLLVQLFLVYLALPRVGNNLEDKFPGLPQGLSELLTLDAIYVGILVLGLNYGAYMTEIFRAGIQSVSHGQSEAADALGMTYRQKMRRIVLPQAFRVVIPPTGNEFIAMMKDTALVSVLGATAQTAEIFRRGQLVGNSDARPLEGMVTLAALYWALTAIFTYFQSRLERRVSKGYVRAVVGSRRERGKAVVTGAAGSGRGGAHGYLMETPDTPDAVGSPHAGGTRDPVVGVPPMTARPDDPGEDR